MEIRCENEPISQTVKRKEKKLIAKLFDVKQNVYFANSENFHSIHRRARDIVQSKRNSF